MKIVYSPHARKRMRLRGIRASDIQTVIKAPNKVFYSAPRHRYIVSKHLREKELEVVYTIESLKIIVITTYFI